jgi:hypothetical protein
MNPIAKILGPLSNIIGGLLGGITPRTAQSIKKGYLFFIFILVIIALMIGWNRGKHSAMIKSSPLAERVNDVFKIDVNKEREDGDFGTVLDSTIISETRNARPQKIEFPARESLEPEFEGGIIDHSTEKRRASDLEATDNLMEGEYMPFSEPERQVETLKKTIDSGKPKESKENLAPMRPQADKPHNKKRIEQRVPQNTPETGRDNSVPVLKKNTGREKTEEVELKPLKGSSGIIEK